MLAYLILDELSPFVVNSYLGSICFFQFDKRYMCVENLEFSFLN